MITTQSNFSPSPTQKTKQSISQQYFHQKINKTHKRWNYSSLTALTADLPLLYDHQNQEEKPFTPFSEMRSQFLQKNMENLNDKQIKKSPSKIQSIYKAQIKKVLEINKYQFNEVTCQQLEKQWKSYNNSYQDVIQNKQVDSFLIKKIKIKDNLQEQTRKSNQIKFLKYQQDLKSPSLSTMLETLKTIPIYGYSITNSLQWRPQVREGPSLTYFNEKCYMYGGVSCQLFNDWCTLSMNGWSWRKMGSGSGEIPFEGRFGHTCNLYKNQFVIFGGECRYNADLHIKECYNQAILFDPKEFKWQQIKAYGHFIEPRRNHTACIINQFLFVIGGVDCYGDLLRDVAMFNLETGTWTKLEFSAPYESGLAFHTAIPLFQSQISFSSPYDTVNFQRDKNAKKISNSSIYHEGIYIYGGSFLDSIPEDVQSKLYILQFGERPLQMKSIATYGVGPPSLAQHTMNYCEVQNILVIYGGRSENPQHKQDSSIQMFILNLFNYIWTPVKTKGLTMNPRIGHNTLMIDQKLILFGGFCYDKFSSCDIVIYELDNVKVRKMLRYIKEQRQTTLEILPPDQEFQVVLQAKRMNSQEDDTILFQVLANTNANNLRRNTKPVIDASPRSNFKNLRSFMPLPQRENEKYTKIFLQKKLKRFNQVLKEDSLND